MPRFLALYIGSVSRERKENAKPMSPEDQQAGMTVFGDWVHKNQKVIVDMGSLL